jgi:hypothetical protein
VVHDGFVGLVLFVVGGVVGPVSVGVVASSVFVAVPCDVGGERAAACRGVGLSVPFDVGVFLVVPVGGVLGWLGGGAWKYIGCEM